MSDSERLISGPGGIMEMKQTIADKEAEIEYLHEVLKRIEDICAEDGIPHEIRSLRAMREARTALGEKE